MQLSTYAFASAGIIFSRILEEHNKSGGSSDWLPQPLMSKSHHLLELHLFLEALGSIEPTDPHFHFCTKAFRIFSNVSRALGGTVSFDALNRGGLHPLETEQTLDLDSSNDSEFHLSRISSFGVLPWLDYVWVDTDETFNLSQFATDPIGWENWNIMF